MKWWAVETPTLLSDPMSVGRHIVELNASNNAPVRTYVWGLDLSGTLDGAGGLGGLLWVTLNTGTASGTHFCAYDGNGNVAALVKAQDGTVSANYEYGPFAEPIRVTGPAARANPFRFSTKRTDDTTDLVLYEYRAYSSSLGRWLSRDPIGEEHDLNLYGFIGNDGLNYCDDSGLSKFPRNPAPTPRPRPRDPRRNPKPTPLPLPPRPREEPPEDWPGPTVDELNASLLTHLPGAVAGRCAKAGPPSPVTALQKCKCCVVSICWSEGRVTGHLSVLVEGVSVFEKTCSRVWMEFRLYGTIGPGCPKDYSADTVLIPW